MATKVPEQWLPSQVQSIPLIYWYQIMLLGDGYYRGVNKLLGAVPQLVVKSYVVLIISLTPNPFCHHATSVMKSTCFRLLAGWVEYQMCSLYETYFSY